MDLDQNICKTCSHTAREHMDPTVKYSHHISCCRVCPTCHHFEAKYRWDSPEGEPVIDTEYQQDCLCPYCGKAVSDVWEYDLNEDDLTEITCGWCGKDFNCKFIVTREYTTTKKEQRASDDP